MFVELVSGEAAGGSRERLSFFGASAVHLASPREPDAARVEAVRAPVDLCGQIVNSRRLTNSLAVIVRDDSGPSFEARLNIELKRLN